MREEVIGLLGIFLIMLVGLFYFIQLGGYVTKVSEAQQGYIEIEPIVVNAGEVVYVTVHTGDQGAYKYLSLHRANGARVHRVNWCLNGISECISGDCKRGHKCEGVRKLSLTTSVGWVPGIYYARVYDYEVDDYISKTFEIQ